MVKNVSGRVWKSAGSKKSSLITSSNVSKLGFTLRQEKLKKAQTAKLLETELRLETKTLKESQRKDREIREQRKAENQLKNEITVSVNANKVKRMKKKQLKAIRMNK